MCAEQFSYPLRHCLFPHDLRRIVFTSGPLSSHAYRTFKLKADRICLFSVDIARPSVYPNLLFGLSLEGKSRKNDRIHTKEYRITEIDNPHSKLNPSSLCPHPRRPPKLVINTGLANDDRRKKNSLW